jgi:hypothetical protein
MSNNNDTNYFNDLSNSDMLFINILNSMYNDNLRIVHHLIDQNTQIRNTIINIMNNRRTHNISSNNRNNIRTNNRTRTNNENSNLNDRQSRLYIVDNLPFYLDTSQISTMPSFNNYLNRNTNNSDVNNINLSRILSSFLDPVNVVPTQLQIENATRNITYGDILDPINNSCPISLEQFTDSSLVTMIRHCRHIFNSNSLMAWFNSSCKCPVCRYDIRNYNSNNSNNETDNQPTNETNETNEPPPEPQPQPQPQPERVYNTNRRNNNISRANYVDNILDALHDFSGNNTIEYSVDDASALFALLYPPSTRRER